MTTHMSSSATQQPPIRVGYTERHPFNLYPNFKNINLNPRISKWSRREECHPTCALPQRKKQGAQILPFVLIVL